MDKVITFFGYIQNYVVAGRRNGRPSRRNDSPVTQKQEENKDYFSRGESGSETKANIDKHPSCSGVNSTNAACKDSHSGDEKDDEDRTVKDAEFLCGEGEEVKFMPANDIDHKPQTRFAHVKMDACKNQALLPPVDSPSSSSFKLASKVAGDGANDFRRQPLGASPGRLHEDVWKKQDILLSSNAARDLPPDRRVLRGGDRRGTGLLPDIFSTIGKPLIQVRQPSFYLPVNSTPQTLVSVTTEFSPTLDDPKTSAMDEQSGSKLPNLKKTKKKKKKKKNKIVNDPPCDNLAEGSGKTNEKESEHTYEMNGTVKLCAEVSSGELEEASKVQEKRTTSVDGAGGGAHCNEERQRQQRPRTALGKWIKKRSNSVAPAPYQDSISDTHDDASAQSKEVTSQDITSENHHVCSSSLQMTEEKVEPSSNSDEPPFPVYKTVLVSERKTNVTKFMMKEDTTSEQDSPTMKEDRLKMENDNEDKEQSRHRAAKKVDKPEYQKENVGESASKCLRMTEEVKAPNATSKASPTPSRERIETLSKGSDGDGADHTPKAMNNNDNTEAKRNERLGGRKKELITLDMRSGLSEPPTVSKKVSKSKSYKRGAVKQQFEKSTTLVAEEAKCEAQAKVSTETDYELDTMCLSTSPPPEGQAHGRKRNSKVQKKVRFNLKHEVINRESSCTTVTPTSPYTAHSWNPRKPTTFTQQFRALTSTDYFPGGSSDTFPIPDIKPKWHGGGPCLPSIRSGKKSDMVQDFLQKYRRKKEREREEDFEGFGEPEPEEVKRILERPITVTPPRYPTHWDPLPTERPPGRGGQGYCLGVLWATPEKSFLSDSSSEDIPELTRDEEETFAFQSKSRRSATPRKSMFADYSFLDHNSTVQEPATWCRSTRLPKHSFQQPLSKIQSTRGDGVALEDFENTPDL